MEYNGTNLKVFVNNNSDAILPVIGTMPSTGQDFYMGWGLPGQDQYFTGIIDEVKIYGE